MLFSQKKCGYETYKTSCIVFDKINKFSPKILIIHFGADTLKSDPDASKLYKCGLCVEDYTKNWAIIEINFVKIIITQKGGYDLDNVHDIINNFQTGLSKFI